MSIELVRAFTAYKTKNVKIKARQSRERIEELQPALAEIGRAIIDLQAGGATITDISNIIGLKNRNFIYDAKRAYQGVPEVEEHDPDVEEPDTQPSTIEDSWTSIGQDTYCVTIDGVDYEVWYDDANLFLSEDLIDLSQQSKEYKVTVQRIIAEIERAHEAA